MTSSFSKRQDLGFDTSDWRRSNVAYEVLGRSLQMSTAAAIDTTAAAHAIGLFKDREIARSPSSDAITRHSRSAGAAIRTPSIAANSRAVLVIAACRA
ncbi:MAG TPA: hypothetical protein VF148_02190 [Acidimicrobiia bacterium]